MSNRKDCVWEDLILSMLSVNNYSLERTYLAVETLRNEGLFRPENLMRWSLGEIEERLQRGGYDRGKFMTTLFASRILSLGVFVKSRGPEQCEAILQKGDSSEIKGFLSNVKGIGPKVLDNFHLLRKGR